MPRAIIRTRPEEGAPWREQAFSSLDAAINAYKDLVASVGAPGACPCREAELLVVEPGMQRAVRAPLPNQSVSGISGYAPVASVRLARINLSKGGAALRTEICAHEPRTEYSRAMFEHICAHDKRDGNAARVTVTWSRAPQGSCAGWSFPHNTRFESADRALDALAETAAQYDALGLRLLHASIDADLRDIDEDAPNGFVIACIVQSTAPTSLYERATPDNTGFACDEEARAALWRLDAMPAPPRMTSWHDGETV